MSNELNVLFPGKEVKLSTGETITIKPFTIGQLPKAIKLGQKIGVLCAQMAQDGAFDDKSRVGANVIGIISEGGEDLFALMSLGIGKPREWFDEVPSDDGLNLVVAFLEVNVDFFTQRVLPALTEAMKNFRPAKPH